MAVYNIPSSHNEHYVEKYPRDRDIMVRGSEATEESVTRGS